MNKLPSAKGRRLLRKERAAIQSLYPNARITEIKCGTQDWDLTITGSRPDLASAPIANAAPINFVAHIKLSAIRQASWCDSSYAVLSSYPAMVCSGDWSGIRDSEPEQIDAMFTLAMRELGLAR